MRSEIKKLHNRLQSTMIYVTHDQVEALTLGDRIVVMKGGVVQQVDKPIRLYENPQNKFIAGFIGSPPMNFLKGTIIPQNGDLYFTDKGIRLKILRHHQKLLSKYVNRAIYFGVRPEDIYDKLFAQDASEEFMATATVDLVEPMGSEIYIYFTIGHNNFIARVNNQDTAVERQDVQVVFDMSKAHFFDLQTEQAIV